jgi:hypothetical protein
MLDTVTSGVRSDPWVAASRTPVVARIEDVAMRLRSPKPTTKAWTSLALFLILALGACTTFTPPAHRHHPFRHTVRTTVPPTTSTTTSTTMAATGPGGVVVGPLTSPPLPSPGPGFVAGHVTAVGDSVMLDYQDPLTADVPGTTVEAAVGRQWYDGESVLSELKAQGQLGSVVVVALGTNGPITSSDFTAMMSILSGASRVVFVTVHVDRPWQDSVNGVLTAGVAQYPNTVLADWATLADQNPQWLYSDGTHLPIDGTGADALAALIASKV